MAELGGFYLCTLKKDATLLRTPQKLVVTYMPLLKLFFSLTPFRRHLLLTLGNGSEKWLSCPWAYTGRLNFFCFTCAIARPLSPRAGSLTIRRVCFLLYSYYPTVSMADPDARWHQSCMHACARPIPTALWLLPASCTKLYVLRRLDQNCTYIQYSSNLGSNFFFLSSNEWLRE